MLTYYRFILELTDAANSSVIKSYSWDLRKRNELICINIHYRRTRFYLDRVYKCNLVTKQIMIFLYY